MEDGVQLQQLIRRIDILILLELDRSRGGGGVPFAEKIERLNDLGLAASEIAKVLGKPVNYVTATLSRKKKSAKKKQRSRV